MDRDPTYTNPNNYAHVYHPNHNLSGPPQPQWQATPAPPPRPRWGDPRNSTPAPQQEHPAAAPGQPYYNPNQYGPMPGSPAAPQQPPIPNAAWGVKYQQAQSQQQHQQYQDNEARPALPPRPVSRVDTPASPYQTQTPAYWQGRPSESQAPSTATPQPSQQQPSDPWLAYCAPQQQPLPPPPPPRPLEYQNQLNQLATNQNAPNWQHDLYSQHAPSHHYEPSSNNPTWGASPPSQQPLNTSSPSNAPYGYSQPPAHELPLVSPVEPHNEPWHHPGQEPFQVPPPQTPSYEQYQVATGATKPDSSSPIPAQVATALGSGAPSDWEYFSTDGGNVSPEVAHSSPAKPKPQEFRDARHPSINTSENSNSTQGYRDDAARPQDHAPSRSRQGSASSSVPELGIQRTGTIDSVISAWNAPLKTRKSSIRNASATGSPLRQDAALATDSSHIQAHLQDLRTNTPTPQQSSMAGSIVDPYADLEPQSRASLARFVKMLRNESAAESDEEKHKVFDAFVQKETRLRAVLYDIDLTTPKAPLSVQQEQKHVVTSSSLKASSEKHKATEPTTTKIVPPDVYIPSTPEENKAPELTAPVDSSSIGDISTVPVPKFEAKKSETPPRALTPKLESSPRSTDNSYVVINQDQSTDHEEYSPGGRPLLRQPIMLDTRSNPAPAPVLNAPAPHEPRPIEMVDMGSPSDNAPQLVTEDYGTGPESPSLAAPIVLQPEQDEVSNTTLNGPANGLSRANTVRFQPPRPAYTPFRYNEGTQPQVETLSVPRPPDQSYASLRHSADAGRLMTSDAAPLLPSRDALKSPTSARKEHEETFLGLIRSHSTAQRRDGPISVPDSIRPRTAPPSKRTLQDPVKGAVEALRAFLPSKLPEKGQTVKLLKNSARLDQIPDEFGFIRNTVLTWDSANRELRKKLDEERHKRQEESEIHIDELFNQKEIAYADIKDMEADFKLAEAERKYEEDKQELESFSQGVYTPVNARLQREVDQLNAEYTLAVDMLDLESDPAGRMLNDDPNSSRASMASAMDLVLQLFSKLNIRHQKLAEARFERERRRKRLELTVLYTNGDSAGMKRLDAEFATAEKMQVLREAREGDVRANKLMDTFDRATVGGLGDNQAVVDDLLVKVQKLNDALLEDKEKQLGSTSVSDAKNVLERARDIAEFVLTDSRALLTSSNAADMGLNEADYGVSLAEARVADAGDETLGKLKKDKEREDEKLSEEMGVRMGGIEKGPRDVVGLVGEVLGRMGMGNESGMGGGNVMGGGGEDREERMKKALEEAKMRNTPKPKDG